MTTRILVKTLAFKLEVVADALVDTLRHTPAGLQATTPQETQGSVYAKELLDIQTDGTAGASV